MPNILTSCLNLCVFLFNFNIALCRMDFLMTDFESRRLLGITAELWYVRSGTVNDYALRFNIPVPAHVTEIYFNWQNLQASEPIFYRMEIQNSNMRALEMPLANISSTGQVPSDMSTFKVMFRCTGRLSTEVDVIIQLNVTMLSTANFTTLNVKRRKMCIKNGDELLYSGGSTSNFRPHMVYDLVNDTFRSRQETNEEELPHFASHVLDYYLIIFGSLGGFILLIVFSVCVHRLKTRKSQHSALSDGSSSQALSQQAMLRSETPNTSLTASSQGASALRSGRSQVTAAPSLITIVSDCRPPPSIVESQQLLATIAIERQQVTLKDVIMEGTFGRIYQGVLHFENEEDEEDTDGINQDVYVKTLTDQARQDQISVMLHESCLLKDLSHKNLNPIIGACVEPEQIPLLIYPHCADGNLKRYLTRCRASDASTHALSTQKLVDFAIQVVRAIQYLHRRKIVHKDVATRNCVLDEDLTVKLTDNSLSRDLFPNDYHCLGDNENRPVKWLSLEALLERRFSTASDVWAFGIFLWELTTFAQQPYGDIDPFEMAAYLQEGYRIAQPPNCPDELFSVMACCWALLPDDRPKFSQLSFCLQDFHKALGSYI